MDPLLHTLAPRDRIAALADPGSLGAVDAASDAPRPSPHLARWGIAAQDDDGIVVARATVHGRPVLIAAQDEHFLGGSVGAIHGAVLAALFERARRERPAAIVFLAASGGVRLHEANPAELALARALAALLAARAAGIPVLALGVGDVFGGASVVFCAADRMAMAPGRRLGLSGPGVIETTHGRAELDASDADAVTALFGADARAARGQLELLIDAPDAVRRWIADGAQTPEPFDARVARDHERLGARLRDCRAAAPPGSAASAAAPPDDRCFAQADAVDPSGALWKRRAEPVWLTRPGGSAHFGPRAAHAVDTALIKAFAGAQPGETRTLFLVEDTPGHEATSSAEALCVSQYLAQHAAVLALLHARGVNVVGLLAGVGHSAAFFANALQAPRMLALASARVVAMAPNAIARVTRLDAARLGELIEDDPLVGHPVRCFAQWGGVAEIVADVDAALSNASAATRG